MSEDRLQIILAVENAILREALMSAIAPLNCLPKTMLPEALLQAELSGVNLIFLETSDDVERLVKTAQQLWDTWGATGRADIQFLSYSTEAVTPDSVVFRLWGIGPEMTVIVQVWRPDNLQEWQQYAYNIAHRCLKWQPSSNE